MAIFIYKFKAMKLIAIRLIVLLLLFSLISCTQDSQKDQSANLFKKAVTILKPGRSIELPHRADYLPDDQSNFLLFFWFTLKALPANGERLVLLSKYVGQPPNIAGYSVGLKRDGSVLRPVVFWGDGSRAGKWLDFPEVRINPGEWNFFALQVHKANFIGLYHYKKSESMLDELSYLGSYPVDIKAAGEADMILGSPVGRDFKGKIGPFGIINPFKFRVEEVQPILSEYVRNPEDFSVLGEPENIKLLVLDGLKDSSINSAQIKTNIKIQEKLP